MFNFNQFINENNEFNHIEVGDIIRIAGSRKKVTDVGHGIIHLGAMKINKAQWKEKDGEIIEKSNKKDEK